jgi:hypothetical protein
VLHRSAPGFYEGSLIAPHPGNYRVQIEDPDGRWRLTGEWNGAASQFNLGVAP